ncbi:MAG: hypothetical protein PHF67_00460 [Candidatus Nanoarchaeia archaeon]|nr:hypothetical protein [Candidatus Nanoarchaeia archaeon]
MANKFLKACTLGLAGLVAAAGTTGCSSTHNHTLTNPSIPYRTSDLNRTPVNPAYAPFVTSSELYQNGVKSRVVLGNVGSSNQLRPWVEFNLGNTTYGIDPYEGNGGTLKVDGTREVEYTGRLFCQSTSTAYNPLATFNAPHTKEQVETYRKLGTSNTRKKDNANDTAEDALPLFLFALFLL